MNCVVFLAVATLQAISCQEVLLPTIAPLKVPRSIPPEEKKLLEAPLKMDFEPKGTLPPPKSGSSGISGQIINGVTSTRGQWPSQAYVLQDNSFICGGSLIANLWILTAAHCAQGRTNFQITLGAQDLSVFENGRVRFDTTLKYIHPNYSTSTLNNDIALLKLPVAVATVNPFWGVVQLPFKNQTSITFAGLNAVIIGWGRTSNSSSASSSILKHALTVNVITNVQCASSYGPGIVVPSTICINTTVSTTCMGDSGGPLLIRYPATSTKYILIGVTSFVGGTNCPFGIPAAFARVTSFIGWISSVTGIAFP